VKRAWKKYLMLGMAIYCIGQDAKANGYKILCMKDTEATSMGEAFVAQADNPSAVTFNPSGLPQLRGNQLNIQSTFAEEYTDYTSPLGQKTHNVDELQAVPSFFFTSDLGTENVGAGIGISFPDGLSSEWGEKSFARYVATYSQLMVADISPAVGVRVNDKLMIGAGLDYYYSTVQFDSMVNPAFLGGPSGSPDAQSRLNGDGSAWGGTLGAIYEITPRNRVAVAYHLPYRIGYDGTYNMPNLMIHSDVGATIDYPAVAVVGYAFKPDDKWTFEFDVDWTDWKSVNDIVIHFNTPGMPDVVQAQDLNDTVALKLGAQYKYSHNLTLRAGYIYNQNATSETTWRPSLPDSDMQFLTGGSGYNFGNVTVDTALQLVYYERRTIENNINPVIDGTYETIAPCASVSATYHF